MKQLRLLLCGLAVLVLPVSYAAEGENMHQDISDKIQGVWNIEYMDVGIGPNSRT